MAQCSSDLSPGSPPAHSHYPLPFTPQTSTPIFINMFLNLHTMVGFIMACSHLCAFVDPPPHPSPCPPALLLLVPALGAPFIFMSRDALAGFPLLW